MDAITSIMLNHEPPVQETAAEIAARHNRKAEERFFWPCPHSAPQPRKRAPGSPGASSSITQVMHAARPRRTGSLDIIRPSPAIRLARERKHDDRQQSQPPLHPLRTAHARRLPGRPLPGITGRRRLTTGQCPTHSKPAAPSGRECGNAGDISSSPASPDAARRGGQNATAGTGHCPGAESVGTGPRRKRAPARQSNWPAGQRITRQANMLEENMAGSIISARRSRPQPQKPAGIVNIC